MKTHYRYIDAAVLRASAHGDQLLSGLWPDPDHADEPEQWRRWLQLAWAQSAVNESVAIASPALTARIGAICAGQSLSTGELRRAALSLARYLVRMRGRATPFGLFAGVAPLLLGQQTTVRWAEAGRTRTRADARWLATVVARLEACPELLRRLAVMVNPLATVRGERLLVPTMRDADRVTEISIRHSQPVQAIIAAGRAPIQVARLLDTLAARFPRADISAFEDMVRALVDCDVLITNIRPSNTTADTMAHVLDQLKCAGADTLSEVALVIAQLEKIHALMRFADVETTSNAMTARRTATARMRALTHAVEQPMMVDLRLGCEISLPRCVATEAASAAEVLARLSPYPSGNPEWRDYHQKFLDRYGPGAVVPVAGLVDPTVGLGFPSHYLEPQRLRSTPDSSRRDEGLLSLAQQAALDGEQEIVLDDEAIRTLAVAQEPIRRSPHLDICVEVRAATVAELAAGAFTLAVTGTGATAVATSGRFLDVLPSADRQRVIELYRQLPVAVHGALAAQLRFPPNELRSRNVLRSPRVLPLMISLAEYDMDAALSVRDLAVTADHHRMYVLSESRRSVVEPVLTCAAARHAMPNLARLLFEIPRATNAAVSLFDWGTARCLPFRPRVRHGRVILSSARWRIAANQLPGKTASLNEWTSAMTAIREHLRLPVSVYVGTADERLRLHLDDALDLALLREHINRATGPITLMEAPTATDHGWLDGRAHEIVIPLVSTAQPAPSPLAVARSAPLPVVNATDSQLPGSSVLFAKLYGHPDMFDTILTRHLPDLLGMWDAPPLWWFVRYRTPRPHLRLRFHRVPDYGQAADRVGRWASALRERGLMGDLTLDTYHPEIARYGTGAAMAAAHDLFAADSVAVVAELDARSASPETLLTAVSLIDLADAMFGDRRAAMRWFIDRPELAAPAPACDREVVRQAIQLTDQAPILNGVLGGQRIEHAWTHRRRMVDDYTCQVTGTHVQPTTVLVSLLHMHCVRAHGIDPAAEAASLRLARAVALSWHARHDRNTEQTR